MVTDTVSCDSVNARIGRSHLHGQPSLALWTECDQIGVPNRGDGCMGWSGALQKGHNRSPTSC